MASSNVMPYCTASSLPPWLPILLKYMCMENAATGIEASVRVAFHRRMAGCRYPRFTDAVPPAMGRMPPYLVPGMALPSSSLSVPAWPSDEADTTAAYSSARS